MKILSRLLLPLFIVLILDGLTKLWAEQTLEFLQPVPVIGEMFRLTLGYNTGIAFGMFTNGGPWPLILTGIVIVGLMIWFTRALLKRQFPALANWPIGLLLGGAIGNFVDRIPDGRVTDFIDVGLGTTRWPTFNLADSFILLGLAWLMLITNPQQEAVEDIDQSDAPFLESDALDNDPE